MSTMQRNPKIKNSKYRYLLKAAFKQLVTDQTRITKETSFIIDMSATTRSNSINLYKV